MPDTKLRPILAPFPVTAPVPIIRDTPTLPTRPTLRAVANEVIAQVKYATVVNVTHEQGGAPRRLDHALKAFLSSRTSAAQQRAAAHSRRLLGDTEAQRTAELGRYANLPASEYLASGFDTTPRGVPELRIVAVDLKNDLTALRAHDLTLPPGVITHPKPDADLQAGLAFTKLRFFIRGVRCVEETDEWGSDTINIGAVVADPMGNTWIDPQFEVSDDFDSGEKVAYPGVGRKLTGWNLVTSEPWPHSYVVTLAMAEKDDGGFAKFLKELWDYIDDKVNALIAAGLGAALGAELGGIIGAVVGAVVGAIVGWIISLFDNEDEILGARVLTMTLASARKSYYDWAQLTSEPGFKSVTDFYGDGGHYRVSYGWKVFAQ